MPETFLPRHLMWPDYLLIALYFMLNLFIGWWCGRRRASGGSFFLGSSLPWWAIGISFYATAASSISYMALPAKTFTDNWLAVGAVPAQGLALIPIAFFFAGILRRLEVTTIYEYIEVRYGRAVRLLGAFFGVLMAIFSRMSVVMLLPSLALAAVTGINVYLFIAAMGIVTVIYSAEGGFDAVIWSDVIQVFVMFGGVAVAFWFLFSGVDGGLRGVLTYASEAGRFEMLSLEPSLQEPTLLVFGGMFIAMIFVQLSDQTLMQRVFAATDEKNARRTLFMGFCLGFPSALLFFFVGTCLWVYYSQNADRLLEGIPNDAIFPYFIANELPVGFVGLIVAGLLAASMSTLSSALNSSAAIIERDFYSPLRPQSTEADRLRVARWTTVAAGLLATIMAMYLASLEVRSLWDKFIELTALFGGAFPGVFALGLLTRRANSAGAFCGVAASVLATWAVQTYSEISPFFHVFVALATCMIVGYCISWITPTRNNDIEHLLLRRKRS